jgi:hypothetical protein
LTLLAVLAGISWLGYLLYQKFQRPGESPINAIPGNTALIIKLNKAGNLWGELNRSNLLWKELARFPGISSVRNDLRIVDSVSRKNAMISNILHNYNVLIAISLSGRTTFGTLYLTSVSGSDPASYILDFVQEMNEGTLLVSESPYASTRIHRIQARGSRDPFYFAVLKGVFMGSFHADLVKKSIDRLLLNTPLAATAGFRRVESTTGKKADANIFINYRFFSLVLSGITSEANLPDLIKFSHFADWSGMDLIIKKDELLLNGYTVAPDSNLQYLSLFSEQQPQKIEITSIVPAAVSYLTFYGWSNPGYFIRRYMERAARSEEYMGVPFTPAVIQDPAPVAVDRYYLPWVGNEGCLFVIEDAIEPEGKHYAAIRMTDSLLAASNLKALSAEMGLKTDSALYHGHKIHFCPASETLPLVFGELFTKVLARYYTILGNYIVFSQHRKYLELLIDARANGTTLDKDAEYIDFSNNISDKANIFTYFNTRHSILNLKRMLNEELNTQLNPVIDSIRKFESVAFQFSSRDGMFYSGFFLRFNPNSGKEGPLLWQAALDTTVAGQPEIINTTPRGSPAVVVTDIADNLYMINPNGSVAWKIHIMGKLLGKVHPVRPGNSDSVFLLFNTSTHLYLIRSDGRFADKFPMRFPLNATNGLAVADYNLNHDYQVLVAFQDNRLYNFKLDGKSMQSWERPLMKNVISLPAQVKKAGNNHYILVSDEKGEVFMADRTGKRAVILPPAFIHSPNSRFYVNRTGKKGMFLTTDPDGKALFVNDNGKFSGVTLNLFSNNHRFFYEDITGNGQPEFIYFDRNSIYYYNRAYKLIYSYSFRREITVPPFVVNTPEGKVMIGIVAPETNELYLFDRHGYREMVSGIRGNSLFDVGMLQQCEHLNLVVGSGKMIRNYQLTKP